LTDHNGKKVDFRNVILIMTTNAGAAELAKPAIGFGKSEREGDDQEAINRMFTPEFRNRLDAVVPFGSLPPEVVYEVVQKFVMQLEAQLADRGVTFDLSPDAIKWLAERGYDSRMGARPLARVIQENIKQPLADEVLFGKLRKGGTVKVTTKEDGSGLELEALEDGPVKPKPEPVPKPRRPRKRKTASAAKKPPSNGKPPGGGGRGLVPKVPLKTT
ncbi:MAG: AAA family ATPase, partial [Bauldia sp.]|nr:AAA family ATPase [Bauldia sp.]